MRRLQSALAAGIAAMAVAGLCGCPTREFYLQAAQFDWRGQGIRRLAVPAFQAPPEAWVIADTARRGMVEALAKGTVQVVEGPAEATLVGAVAGFHETATPSSPRRVSQPGMYGLPTEAYQWQQDVTHAVQFRLVLRLVTAKGLVVWTREAPGEANEAATMPMDWPGGNPVPPPNQLPVTPDLTVLQRLRQRALDQAIAPLVEAVAVHYAYRDLR